MRSKTAFILMWPLGDSGSVTNALKLHHIKEGHDNKNGPKCDLQSNLLDVTNGRDVQIMESKN